VRHPAEPPAAIDQGDALGASRFLNSERMARFRWPRLGARIRPRAVIARLSAVTFVTVMAMSPGISQDASPPYDTRDFAKVFGVARRELLQGNYLSAIELVRPFALAESPHGLPTIRNAYAFQVWNQMQAMVSGEPSALQPDTIESSDQQMVTAVAESTGRDALTAIVDRARSTKVVILNENHATPCQRVFAARLAERLRPLGYDTLALEALATVPANTAVELQKRGYPLYGDGFYTRDPAFARFIRRSLQLGYAPLAYEYNASREAPQNSGDSRERGQAENLTRFLSTHPRAKLLVYSGGSHLAERPLADGSKMMGQWLKELSGIDPLTIDQNRLQPTTATRRYLIKRKIASDTVLFLGSTPLVVGSIAGRVDMQVLPASSQYISGRPRCLLSSQGELRHYSPQKHSRTGVRLIQAFGKTDDRRAVPLDQVAAYKERFRFSLIMPDKSVRIVVTNR